MKLTANRGDIANTDPKILDELKSEIQDIISKLDAELQSNGYYTLRTWEQEERTLDQEKSEFSRRIKDIKVRNVAEFKGHMLFEPRNESELFGMLTTLVAIAPEVFDFEPMDYNTTKEIDLVVRDKRLVLAEHNLGYAELKRYLTPKFNHAFNYLRWIICWEFGANVGIGTNFEGISEGDIRQLKAAKENGYHVYWLDAPNAANKIHVINLKELLEAKLNRRANKDVSCSPAKMMMFRRCRPSRLLLPSWGTSAALPSSPPPFALTSPRPRLQQTPGVGKQTSLADKSFKFQSNIWWSRGGSNP